MYGGLLAIKLGLIIIKLIKLLTYFVICHKWNKAFNEPMFFGDRNINSKNKTSNEKTGKKPQNSSRSERVTELQKKRKTT